MTLFFMLLSLKKSTQLCFFQKRARKIFLRLAINEGFEKASSEITTWRSRLIAEPLGSLFKITSHVLAYLYFSVFGLVTL